MFSKTKLDFDAIPGIQEIEDSIAELYVGGAGFDVDRRFPLSFLRSSTSDYTAQAGFGFPGRGVGAITIRSHEGQQRRFALYVRGIDGETQLIDARNLQQGEEWNFNLNNTPVALPPGNINVAIVFGDNPTQTRIRAINTLNGLPEPIQPLCPIASFGPPCNPIS